MSATQLRNPRQAAELANPKVKAALDTLLIKAFHETRVRQEFDNLVDLVGFFLRDGSGVKRHLSEKPELLETARRSVRRLAEKRRAAMRARIRT